MAATFKVDIDNGQLNVSSPNVLKGIGEKKSLKIHPFIIRVTIPLTGNEVWDEGEAERKREKFLNRKKQPKEDQEQEGKEEARRQKEAVKKAERDKKKIENLTESMAYDVMEQIEKELREIVKGLDKDVQNAQKEDKRGINKKAYSEASKAVEEAEKKIKRMLPLVGMRLRQGLAKLLKNPAAGMVKSESRGGFKGIELVAEFRGDAERYKTVQQRLRTVREEVDKILNGEPGLCTACNKALETYLKTPAEGLGKALAAAADKYEDAILKLTKELENAKDLDKDAAQTASMKPILDAFARRLAAFTKAVESRKDWLKRVVGMTKPDRDFKDKDKDKDKKKTPSSSGLKDVKPVRPLAEADEAKRFQRVLKEALEK